MADIAIAPPTAGPVNTAVCAGRFPAALISAVRKAAQGARDEVQVPPKPPPHRLPRHTARRPSELAL